MSSKALSNVYKLRDIVSAKDPAFGAKGDDTGNDAVGVQAALAASDTVWVPPGTYKTTLAITITTSSKHLLGSGKGVTTIHNIGVGNAIEAKSAGGVDSTKTKIKVAGMTIQGQAGTLSGLYVYDIADSIFEDLECKSNGVDGVSAEMSVDNTFRDIWCTANTRDGIRLNAALKNALEFTSNANSLERCVSGGNTGNALTLNRSYANLVMGGDYSTSANGIVISGGIRNIIFGAWVENNTTDGVRIEQNTVPTTFNADDNKLLESNIAGTGGVRINNGTANSLDGNYIATTINIAGAGATPNTYIGRRNTVVGAITDNGNGTVNLQDASAMYWKSGAAKRFRLEVGATNVDMLSDINAIRVGMLKSLSKTATLGSNVCGNVDIADLATTAAVAFGTAEPDASYNVVLGSWDVTGVPAVNSHITWITARAVGGFTINLGAAPGAGTTVRVFWMLMRV